MRVGIICSRLGGLDGVSLEVDKWTTVLKRMGHEVYFCVGEKIDEKGSSLLTGDDYFELKKSHIIPKMSFSTKDNKRIQRIAYGKRHTELRELIEKNAEEIKDEIEKWMDRRKIDMLVIQNASAIPMHLPLGVALGRLVRGNDIPTIAHHHDFEWERKKYKKMNDVVREYIDEYFPFDHRTVQHVVINKIAEQELYKKKGIKSLILPNVFMYHGMRNLTDDFNRKFREDFKIKEDEIIAFSPVRVIPRKDLRTAIRIVSALNKKLGKKVVLIVSGFTSDVGKPHQRNLMRMAKRLKVKIKFIHNRIKARRHKKFYSLWDIYPHADIVLYPSKIEGWGNAIGEAIAFKKMLVVRRYPVYRTDIEPLGFDFIAFNKYCKNVVNNIAHSLNNPKETQKRVEKNFKIAKDKISYQTLRKKLKRIIDILMLNYS
ncbi:glycosyltransferase [Nanoarchaeota archaeon]